MNTNLFLSKIKKFKMIFKIVFKTTFKLMKLGFEKSSRHKD